MHHGVDHKSDCENNDEEQDIEATIQMPLFFQLVKSTL
jgi:hypothetical protein